jgi:8-oxo-dGTP pyrophosphatase MutT (NUDIX family)
MLRAMSDAPRPLLASTIVVARRRPDDARAADDATDFEIFLVRRHGKSGFMAGVYVFPGGKVDEEDATLSDDARKACAVRETFEETGVLFARPESGLAMTTRGPIEAVRSRLAGGEPFGHALRGAGLVVDEAALVPIAWWITPEAEPRRFDTLFYFAEVPPLQRESAHADDVEVEDGLWLTPKQALRRADDGVVRLAPPTLVTLEELANRTIDDVRAAAWPHDVPVCPRLCEHDGDVVLALPGDPLFDDARPPLWPHRTRVVLKDGRFRSARTPP